jgi:fucose permease
MFLALYGLFMITKHTNDKGEPLKSGCFKLSGFFKNRAFLLLAVGIMLYVGVENTIANFTDSYFEVAMEAPALSATALSLFWGAMIPSRFLAGILKIEPKKIFAVLSTLVFSSAVAAMLIEDQTVKVIMFALCGFGCGPLWPLMMDAAAKKNRGASGPALNIMMAFSGFGGAAMPLMCGVLVGFAGQASAYYASAAAALVMLFTYLASLKGWAARDKDSDSKSL